MKEARQELREDETGKVIPLTREEAEQARREFEDASPWEDVKARLEAKAADG